MTIRRGEEWGLAVARPPDLVVATTDAELARLATTSTRPLAVSGGDLHRAVGAPDVRPTMQRVPIDLLRVRIDGRELTAVAHVVARRSWWRGRVVAVMNVDHLGDWNVAPRAHPNDGRFDVVEVAPSMTLRQRWQARSRLPLGTHVPHPAIAVRIGSDARFDFDRPVRITVDGVDVGSSRTLQVALEPDAFELHV